MPMIHLATPADQEAVEVLVRAAYNVYIDRIGKEPGPMLDDCNTLIQQGVSMSSTTMTASMALLCSSQTPGQCFSTMLP
jgi:hypothetical protein